MKKLLAALGLMALASVCGAQTLTFTSNTVTGDISVTPTLTWSTTPAAASCTASGDWTGAKAVSGTQTLAAINSSKTYNLACTWPGDTTVTARWVAPTTNTNGSAYTDPKGYKLYWNTGAANEATVRAGQSRVINDPATLTTTVTGLATGVWNFGVMAVNQRDIESPISNIASKTITATSSVTRSVGITVNPQPSAVPLTLE